MTQTDFYHGSEVIKETSDNFLIKGANISIIAVVGTTPVFELDEENRKINEAYPISSYSDIAKYLGPNLSEYTLPDAVETIYKEAGRTCKVYIVNVFDPAVHKADLTTTKAFEDGTITLNERGISNLVVKKGDTVCTLDSDYTFENNIIKVTSAGKLKDGGEVTLSYSYADPSKVSAGDIIGTEDENGVKTGLKALLDIESTFGDEVGIVIAPMYESLNAVRQAIEDIIGIKNLDAFSYISSPILTSKLQAIKGRGENGEINFNTSSSDIMLVSPYAERYNSNLDIYETRSLSPVLAGVRVRVDEEEGIHVSISNHALNTVNKLEFPVSFRNGKKDTDAQDYNSKGITTVINHFGYKTYGNRCANFPAANGIETFECCQRVDKYIRKSILNSTFECVDKPITMGYINSVVDAVNSFLDNLKNPAKPVILGGSAWYDTDNNPKEDLSNGWLKINYEFCPPVPCERLSFYGSVSIKILTEALSN